MTPLVVRGMSGLGDCIYQRAFVKALAADRDVYLFTPWPELVEDLPRVRFLRVQTSLRTQAKNVGKQPEIRWQQAPTGIPRIAISYAREPNRPMFASMEACCGVAPAAWDLPAYPPMMAPRPIAVVRPVTQRREWHNPARNPLPEYVNEIAADLMRTHHVISVADLADGLEWLEGPPPPAHEYLHGGELGVRELLGLIQSAAVVVGGAGWIVPACLAARVPLFCVLGGQGARNGPRQLTDPRMDLSHASFAEPDSFCQCSDARHDCDKRNSRIHEQWSSFRRAHAI